MLRSSKMEVKVTPSSSSCTKKKIIDLPSDVIQIIFQLLGPMELNNCRLVCGPWREEVRRRVISLKKYEVKSLEDLQVGLARLKAPTPKFEIERLELSGTRSYHSSHLFTEFINLISPVTLGTLIFHGFEWHITSTQFQDLLQRFTNLYRLEFQCDEDDMEYFELFKYEDEFGMDWEAIFPALRILRLPEYRGSISTVLRSCPNLEKLTMGGLEPPFSKFIDASKLQELVLLYIDVPCMHQLRALNGLNLDRIDFTISSTQHYDIDGNDFPKLVRLMSLLHDFLESQSSTLRTLRLMIQMTLWNRARFHLFPLMLPHLIKLKVDPRLGTDLNVMLTSCPKLQSLLFYAIPEEEDLRIPNFIPTGFLEDHVGIEKLTILEMSTPIELSMFGYAFKNLMSLTLHNVVTGVLSTVFSQMDRLVVLKIHEGPFLKDEVALRDSDFIWITKSDPNRVYIGNMKNLKRLEIYFNILTPERQPILITDAILHHGIFDIISQLDILKMNRVRFSKAAKDRLYSFMKSSSSPALQRSKFDLAKRDDDIENSIQMDTEMG